MEKINVGQMRRGAGDDLYIESPDIDMSMILQSQTITDEETSMVCRYFTNETIRDFFNLEIDMSRSVVLLFERSRDKVDGALERKALRPESMTNLRGEDILRGDFYAFVFTLSESDVAIPLAKMLADYFHGLISRNDPCMDVLNYVNKMTSILKSMGADIPTVGQSSDAPGGATLSNEVVDIFEDTADERVHYYPKPHGYRDKARLLVVDGENTRWKYILAKDSIVRYPAEDTKSYTNNKFYQNNRLYMDALVRRGQLEPINDSEFRVIDDMEVRSPSRAAVMISGRPKNGRDFFVDSEGRTKRFD